jgi:hypothetical protein
VSKLDKRSLTVFTLLILVVSAFSAPALGASLTVETDRESYLDGEHIKISGSGNPGDSVSVAVIANSTTVFESTAVVSPEGFYTLTYLLSGTQPGEYVVEARADGYEAETVFRILGADCRLARDLLALLSRSREKTRDMLRLGEDEHEPEGAFYERYLMAEEAAEEASELFEEGRCQEAAAKATEALRLYGESVKLAREGEEDPGDDVDEGVERILKLKDALGRVHAYLEKVNRTSREFGESGFNVSGVNSLVEEAVRLLLRAEEILGEGMAEEAERLISEAHRHLNRAMELIRELNEVNKIERARRFLTETEDRLSLMEDRIINMLGNLGVPGHILEAVGAVFQNARLGIDDVKDLLETGDVEEAIDEFKEVFEETEEGLNLVEEFDGNRRGLLDELKRLEARRGYLAEKVEALRRSGVDVSKFSYKFEHAKVLLERAVYKLETGQVALAEELIDEIEDIVDAIEEELEALLRRLRSETSLSTDTKDDGGDPDEDEPETGETEEPEETDEQVLEMLRHLDHLKEEIAALVERIEEMRDAGYDVLYLVPKSEAAKRMAEAAIDSLEEGEKEPARVITSELEALLDHVEDALHRIFEVGLDDGKTEEETPEKEPCDEEALKKFANELDELERELAEVIELYESLGEAGARLKTYVHMAISLLAQLAEMEPCDESTARTVSKFLGLLEYIEMEAKLILEKLAAVEACDEETINEFNAKLDALEGEIAVLWEFVESLGDAGAKLEPYFVIVEKLFSELVEIEPCSDLATGLISELVDLLEYIEVEAKIIKESLESEEPERVIRYYALKIGDEVYGKFEWMIVKQVEGEWRMVFEEGVVYDCFVEWILSGVEEVYEPLSGKIVSVDFESVSVIEWYFEGAVPFSIRGSELEAVTGESHPMERLELAFSHVEEA